MCLLSPPDRRWLSLAYFSLLLIYAALLIKFSCFQYPGRPHTVNPPLLSRYAEVFRRAETANIAIAMPTLAIRWSDCSKGLYLDVGSNVGVQIRKLYTPELFVNASVLHLFDQYFGKGVHGDVCAVGFEPNPAHTDYLATVNTWFARKGYPAFIFTESAVGQAKGKLPFFSDSKATASQHQWGASLTRYEPAQGENSTIHHVDVIDFVAFMTQVVRPVLLIEERLSGQRPPVVVKVDIEGSEYAIVPGMILSGALCDVDLAFLEWHGNDTKPANSTRMASEQLINVFNELKSFAPHCRTQLSMVDDESYVDGVSIPLPP